MGANELSSRFVEHIPEHVQPSVLYVSMSLASTIHLYACGLWVRGRSSRSAGMETRRYRKRLDGEILETTERVA